MKHVLFFKMLDLITQLLAVVIPVSLVITRGAAYIIGCYLIVGASQVVSCIINRLLLRKEYRNSSRRVYEYILLAIILFIFTLAAALLVLIHSRISIVGIILSVLMAFSPILAVWYVTITFMETKFIYKKNKIAVE